MKLNELICCLQKCKEKYGNINVCIYNNCHKMPCESIVPIMHKNESYVVFCENKIKQGTFLMLE